jgi:nitrate/TMAO reductase-like tetraheme cytochrome c subunit
LTDPWTEQGASPPEPPRRFERARGLAERYLRPPRTTRGLVLLVVAVGGLGTLVAVGGVQALHWTETEGFCTRCHTMAPEAKAYRLSVHRDVPCAECHVAPGLSGFVKAKINGAKQTLQIVTGAFPRPIRAPDHSMLPDTEDTCMECHSLDEIATASNPTKIVVHPRYREDRENTRETVAVVIRPRGLGQAGGGRGAHWHVQQKVEYTSPDENSQEIDFVKVTYGNGRTKQFIARPEVGVSSDARPDISRLEETQKTRRMDCISCHNRVGHDIPSPDRAIDESMAAGKISPDLPFIKRLSLARVGKNYDSVEEGDRAIAGIRGVYATKYPLLARKRRRQVDAAVEELQLIYRLVATPEMKAIASTYRSNLGHRESAGCFRCHDGDHYQVTPRGRVLEKKTIPWACTTCHTFPQVGREVQSVSLLGKPSSHEDGLWVFDHADDATGVNPEGIGFCANCHESGAARVDHDEMLYRHPTVIEKAGLGACRYCHQPNSCARCHDESVLESENPHPGREPEPLVEGG